MCQADPDWVSRHDTQHLNDSLAAAQVVDLLPSLSPDELDAVERYELAHRNRRTIVGKIAQLRG